MFDDELIQLNKEKKHKKRGRRIPHNIEKKMKRYAKYRARLDQLEKRKRNPYGIYYQENRKYSNALLNLARDNMG